MEIIIFPTVWTLWPIIQRGYRDGPKPMVYAIHLGPITIYPRGR